MFSKAEPLFFASNEEKSSSLKTSLASMTYTGIPHIRADIQDFLEKQHVKKTQIDKFILTASEIITNLLKHPAKKATRINISLTLYSRAMLMDIADDSTPFAAFDAKCNELKEQSGCGKNMNESGNGLKCILTQHKNMIYRRMEDAPDGLNHFTVQESVDKKKTVFLVDDDYFTLAAQAAILEEEYKTVSFASAQEALSAFSAYHPCLIISDLNMPGMNGEDLRRSLSFLAGGDTTPFIFLSAADEKKHCPDIERLGIDDFLQKPVNQKSLQNVVARLIMRSNQMKNAVEKDFHQDLNRDLKPALPPAFGGWRFCLRNKMSDNGGGDLVVSKTTDSCMTAILADVMGHGRAAKFFTYAYAGYLRSMLRAARKDDNIEEIFQRLSDTLYDDEFLAGIIVTCLGFQAFSNGEIRIASAGHPPPLILDGKNWKNLDCAAPLPGLTLNIIYNSKTIRPKPGHKIIFGSDGFFESFRPSECTPETLMRASTEETLDLLWQNFEKNQPTAQAPDDATLIIAEYAGGSHDNK